MCDPSDTFVFLSHSSKDLEYASALVALLTRTISFEDCEIMCTSLPSHTLQPGASYEKDIRKAILAASYFITLTSPNSLSSFFCAIECGVAWSKSKMPLSVICAPNFKGNEVPRPLQSLQILEWKNNFDWHRLLNHIVEETGARRRNVAKWEIYINEIVRM